MPRAKRSNNRSRLKTPEILAAETLPLFQWRRETVFHSDLTLAERALADRGRLSPRLARHFAEANNIGPREDRD